jgi:hypothetical protein
VFVHNLETGITQRVSITSDGTQGNFFSENPVISEDGRYVTFESWASTLIPPDANGSIHVFVHDRLGPFTISGQVTDEESDPISGVEILSNVGISVTTNPNGYFILTNLITGTYTFTPTHPGYTFTPMMRTVSVPPEQVNQDFVAVMLTPTPTASPTQTASPTLTLTSTPTYTPTPGDTPLPTSTQTPKATYTPTSTQTPSPTLTPTPTPTSTLPQLPYEIFFPILLSD